MDSVECQLSKRVPISYMSMWVFFTALYLHEGIALKKYGVTIQDLAARGIISDFTMKISVYCASLQLHLSHRGRYIENCD